MSLDLSDEQRMLAEQIRGLVSERSPADRLRGLIDEGAEWDAPLWRELGDLGFLGAAIPEVYGGLGMSGLDMGVISEELGRANVALPFFSSIVLAADAIRLAGSEAQKSEWLPRLARGEVVGTFAYAEEDGWEQPSTTLDGDRLSGIKVPVADGGIADVAVVLARQEGTLALVLVVLDQPAVLRTKLTSFDQLRAHYAIGFNDARAESLNAADAGDVVDRLFDRAAVQAAFEGVGGAHACLDMARDYVMERKIFGRPLAGYQAIKHKLADILVRIELARASAINAGAIWDAEPKVLAAAASAARLMAVDAFESAARENIQVHGGIGYTFEANCHFYYRRERTLALSLGARDRWADRLIAHVPFTQTAGN